MTQKYIALDAISGDLVAVGDSAEEVTGKVEKLVMVEEFKHLKTPIYSCEVVDGRAINLTEVARLEYARDGSQEASERR